MLPKLITGAEIDAGGQAFQHLKELFTLRNDIVHYKTRVAGPTADLKPKAMFAAKKGVQTVRDVVAALKVIDPDVSDEWLDADAPLIRH